MSARQHGTRASDATFERVRYEHSPSFVERQSAVRSAARERLGMGDDDVALVEEQAAATSAVPRNDAEAEELRQLAKRERRRQRKLQREAEAEAERLRQLEAMAKRLYVAGFFLLPILWLLYLLYFHKEHKTPDANANIKKSTYLTSRWVWPGIANDNELLQCTSV